jgi:hypothetical protein
MRATLPAVLVVVFPVFLLAACLPTPKDGCDTDKDCAHARVCVAGTCQPERRDAGLDASFDRQSSNDGAIDLAETLRRDLMVHPDSAPDHLAPDARATIDAPEGLTGFDASLERLSPDLRGDSTPTSDLAPLVVDVAPDSSVPPMIDASHNPSGLDANADNPYAGDVLSPDLASPLDRVPESAALNIDAPPDAPIVLTIDASSALDASPLGIDADNADYREAGALPPSTVSWEDFRAQTPSEPWTGGRFIVDGDIALDEAGLRDYYNAWFAAVGISPENLAPMGATTLWPFPDSFFLAYCISTDFGSNLATVEDAMQAATASWSSRVGVQYAYLLDENGSCNADNTNVTFDVRPVSGAGYAAVSFFPESPRSTRSLLVDTSTFTASPGGPNLEAVLRHQLGHTLGFQHEHLWLDPACNSEDSRLAVQIAIYDSDSVMHLPACRPSEFGGTIQTEGDLVGAISLYGLSPALTVLLGM